MTKKQSYIIGLLCSILFFSLTIFRPELFSKSTRPNLDIFLKDHFIYWLLSISILSIGFFLAKIFNIKWYIFIFIFILIEIIYALIFYFPNKFLSKSFKVSENIGHFRGINLANRQSIQFIDNCARFDSSIFYTLKPGNCNFDGVEFNNHYEINSKGLRDDENSLKYPKVIFLGDSYTMGWGNEQDSTFCSIFEKKMNTKSLNAGISSYGTAREYLLLKRLNIDSLKLLVLQFHDTDIEENAYFVKNKNLPYRTKDVYNSIVHQNEQLKSYYLFKYLKSGLVDYINTKNQPAEPKAIIDKKFKSINNDFYFIISKIREIYKGNILITYIGSHFTDANRVEYFEQYAKEQNLTNLYFLNLNSHLSSIEDYYYFDDHLNSHGQKKVANALIDYVKAKKILELK